MGVADVVVRRQADHEHVGRIAAAEVLARDRLGRGVEDDVVADRRRQYGVRRILRGRDVVRPVVTETIRSKIPSSHLSTSITKSCGQFAQPPKSKVRRAGIL